MTLTPTLSAAMSSDPMAWNPFRLTVLMPFFERISEKLERNRGVLKIPPLT